MSRFSNLEFGTGFGSEGRQIQDSDQTVEKDEYFFLALADEEFGMADFEGSLRHYAKVLEFNPNSVASWLGQVRALIELGEFREAKLWADKALERFPDEGQLLAAKAVALARCGDTESALAFSDAAIEQRAPTPYIWLARCDVFLARNEPLASSCLERAMAQAKGDWFIAWLATRIHFYYERFAIALKMALVALNLNPGNDALWFQAGLCQRELALSDAASESFERARELNPSNRAAVDALTRLNQRGTMGRLMDKFRLMISPKQ
ncbi:MAG: tetratricopeptide repeat protein [Verrucomicrobiales bacterium]